MNNPLISIIISCYNNERDIRRCMSSVLQQSVGQENMEIILVDDCSADHTAEIIREYEKNYSFVHGIYNAENLRQGGSQNRALKVACGKYIGYVDADDWIEPEMYQAMIDKAEEYHCDLVNILNVRSSKEGFLAPEEIDAGIPDQIIEVKNDQERAEMIAGGQVKIGTWNCIFKRELIENNNVFFPEHLIYEDVFWGGLCHLYFQKCYSLNRRYYHYYVREGSVVLSKNEELHFDFFEMQRQLWKEYCDRNAFDRFGKALEFDYLMNYYIMGVKILALRFSEFPCEKFWHMQNDINEKFPDWRNNPYLVSHTSDFQKIQFELLKSNLTKEELEAAADSIRIYYGA